MIFTVLTDADITVCLMNISNNIIDILVSIVNLLDDYQNYILLEKI